MKTTVFSLFVLLGGLLAAPLCSAEEAATRKPNILLILIDDMGWKDMSCAGSTFYQTPHIDKLSATGMRFTQGYSSSPVCSPSRGAIFSGKNPARTKFTTVHNKKGGGATPDDRLYEVSKYRGGNNQFYEALHHHALPKTETLFSQVLQGAGYNTGFFGKWHCGSSTGYLPPDRGFDVAVGFRDQPVGTSTSGHWGRTFKSYGVGLEGIPDGAYVSDYLTDQCVDFIKENKEKSFLAVMSHYLVHMPLDAIAEKKKKYAKLPKSDQSNATYAAMIESVDDSVGRLLEVLDELGIADNTLVVFTSDNGGFAPTVTSNYPLMGGKSSCFEAGMRVPLILRWPAVMPKVGVITAHRSVAMDLFPTFVEAAGLEMPEQHDDGLSLLPVLKGGQADPHRSIMFHFPHYTGRTSPFSSIIDGRHKLIRFYNDANGGYMLFDLKDDPGEQEDLSSQSPQIVDRLALKMRQQLQAMGAEMPIPNPNYKPNARGLQDRASDYSRALSEYRAFEAKLRNSE